MTRITPVQWTAPLDESILSSPPPLPPLPGLSASLHLLLDLIGVRGRGHLHGLATAAADVPEEAQVGAARHDDRDDDDDGGAEGGRHSVLQDGLEAPQADSAGPPEGLVGVAAGLT